MVRGVVFDFDGLILDTESPVYAAWAEVYRAHGRELPLSLWHSIIGRGRGAFDPHAHLEKLLGRSLDRASIDHGRRARFLELLDTEPRPGVRAWLRDARTHRLGLAVASSSGADWVGGNLRRLALADAFDALVTADDVSRTKPAPELYLRAARAIGVAPEEAIAVEDSPTGIEAAHAAGMFTVAVPGPMTTALDLSQADVEIGSLTDRSLTDVLSDAVKG